MDRIPEPEYMDDANEAEAYAVADFNDVNAAFVQRLLEVTADLPTHGLEAVDLGTGPGDIPLRLAREREGWHIIAVDAAEAMLSWARRAAREAGLAGRIAWVLADAKTLPLGEETFDVVFSNSILHHINEPARFWNEARRVAKNGATWFLRDLARPADDAAARRIVETYAGDESSLLREEFHRSLLSAYTVEEVRGQLDVAGLGDLTVEMTTDRHLDVHGRV